MATSFTAYFAGIGTVVAAMGVGFGGALYLTSTSEVKQDTTFAAKVERSKIEEPQPEPQLQKQQPAPAETTGAATSTPVPTGAQWVAVPPPQTTSAPVVPVTAPLSPPPASEAAPAAATQPSPAAKPEPRSPTEKPPIAAAAAAPSKNIDEKREKVIEPAAKKSVSAKTKPADEQVVEVADDVRPIEATAEPERLPEPPPSIKSIGAVTGNAH